MESLRKLIAKHSDRMGLSVYVSYENMLLYAKVVAEAESRHSLTVKNPTSSATGLYQILDMTQEPMVNRLARTFGMLPWMSELLRHKDIARLDWEQQTLLFMAQTLEQKGTDKFVRQVMTWCCISSMSQLYYRFHHTAPDEPTIRNWKRSVKKVFKCDI